MHKSEIRKWGNRLKLEERLTIVPLKFYLSQGLCKVEVALCKGKKLYDKRDAEKEKEQLNKAQKALKEF